MIGGPPTSYTKKSKILRVKKALPMGGILSASECSFVKDQLSFPAQTHEDPLTVVVVELLK